MVALLEIVAFAPEERALVTLHCAVLIGSRDEGFETERPAVVVVVVVAVLVRDASVLSPLHLRVLARHHRALAHHLPAGSDLPRVLGFSHQVSGLLSGGIGCELASGSVGVIVLSLR